MEHPDIPAWVPPAMCVWYPPVVRALMHSPAVQTARFDQCVHGQVARAPTHLMILRLPELARDLVDTPRGGRCHYPEGHEALSGVDAHGNFRTARKTRYTPNMNRLIATAMVRSIRAAWAPAAPSPTDEGLEDAPSQAPLDALPGALKKFYVAYDSYLEGAFVHEDEALRHQPDFHGRGVGDAAW